MMGWLVRSGFISDKQDRKCTYKLTLRRVRFTIIAVEQHSVLHILGVCLYICEIKK